jgi:predicted MFS family arabinose efflux permease
VVLLSIGFGLVGLDRWLVAPLFPFMMRDLHLGYQELGEIVGILAVTWGVSSILMGAVSDRIGRRQVLIPAVLLFSLLSGLSGLATGLVGLLLLRCATGAVEGAYTPASVAATAEASRPARRGLNQGVMLSLFALLGLGIGPILATQLLAVVPSWRWVFWIVAAPGLLVALLIHLVIRNPPPVATAHAAAPPWLSVLRQRNVIVGTLCILCAMSGVFVLGAMIPSYLLDYLHLTPSQMGLVTSAIGFGGFFGDFAIPGLSDRFGRKPLAIGAFAAAAAALIGFSRIGPAPILLFAALFVCAFFCLGLLGLMTGPVATEAVAAASISSAIGLVSGLGEIFGGGVAPSLAGWIAAHYGIDKVLYLAIGGLALGIPAALALRETAPSRVSSPVA